MHSRMKEVGARVQNVDPHSRNSNRQNSHRPDRISQQERQRERKPKHNTTSKRWENIFSQTRKVEPERSRNDGRNKSVGTPSREGHFSSSRTFQRPERFSTSKQSPSSTTPGRKLENSRGKPIKGQENRTNDRTRQSERYRTRSRGKELSTKSKKDSHRSLHSTSRKRKRSQSMDVVKKSEIDSRKGGSPKRKKPRKEKENIFIHRKDQLAKLLSKDPSQIIMELLNNYEAFCEYLKSKHISSKSIEEIMQILSKLYETPYTENFATIFESFQEKEFISNVRLYVLNLSASKLDEHLQKKQTHLKRIIRFFQEFLTRFPNMCGDLPVDVLSTYSTQWEINNADRENSSTKINSNVAEAGIILEGTGIVLEETVDNEGTDNSQTGEDAGKEINDSIHKLISLRNDLLRQELSTRQTGVVKPDDYKSIPIFPRPQDILSDKPPFLRKNIVKGRYSDVSHYLDVQFRLLREDYIAPLREGVLEATSAHEHRSRSAHVYRNVQVVGRVLDTKSGGLLHRLSFDVSRMKNINWEHSKRFKYGSLYCLMDSASIGDQHQAILHFVTISERNAKDLRKGLLNVKLFSDNLTESISLERRFFMIESPAYFESYRYVLEGLQSFNENNLPFQRYLVECDSEVKPPVYLLQSSKISNDNQVSTKKVGESIGCYDLTEALACKTAKSVPLLKLDEWPSPTQVDVNCSQFNALKAALTQEFVVIQGPPGTGKTFLGLRIANALLANKGVWHRWKPEVEETKEDINHHQMRDKVKPSQILVVCYTNHALDQFLEGIHKITGSLVRVGGRGKNENLQRFNIRERKRLTGGSVRWSNLKGELKSIQRAIEEERSAVEDAKKDLPYSVLEQILNEDETDQLKQWTHVAFQMRVHRIDAWLRMQDELDEEEPRKRKLSSSSHVSFETKYESYLHNKEITLGMFNSNKRLRGQIHESDCGRPFVTGAIENRKMNSNSMIKKHMLKPSCSLSVSPVINATDADSDVLEEGELLGRDDDAFHQSNQANIMASGKDVAKKDETNNLTGTRLKQNQLQRKQTVGFSRSTEAGKLDFFQDPRYGNGVQATSNAFKKEIRDDSSFAENPSKANDEEDETLDGKDALRRGRADKVNEKPEMPTDQSRKPVDIVDEYAEEGEMLDSDSDSEKRLVDNEPVDLTLFFEPKFCHKDVRRAADEDGQMSEQRYQVNLKELSEKQRSDLYNEWVARYFDFHQKNVERLQQQHDKILKQLSEIDDIQTEEVLKNAEVVGMTTTGAAKHRRILQEIKPRIVIVEEAAEVLEGHVITSLSSGTDHLILIGDHKQLKPNPAVYELARKYNLDVSLFERMVANGLTCHSLNTQHRMRPEIANIMRIIYPKLVDDVSVFEEKNIIGIQHNVFFVNHSHLESGNEELKSHSNEHEVAFVTALCSHLLYQGYQRAQITVLTMYTGQLLKLKQSMPKDSFEGIRICSVDNFQGEESDIVILSLVRSNKSGNIGFLNVPNRVCVALSRAKKAMYCIGNISMMAKRNKLWNKIKKHLEANSLIGDSLPLCCPNHPEKKIEASSAEDFKKAPKGGCLSPCDFQLPCGHVCSMPCHPFDRQHEKYTCTEKCLEEMCNLKHRCKRQCHFSTTCGPCTENISFVIPECKHEVEIKCWQRKEISCPRPCTKNLPCGHPCPGKCGQKCESVPCKTMIPRTPHCGHKASIPCSTEVEWYECREPCDKMLECGHKCSGNCCRCREGTFHIRCKEPCKRQLICSHECQEPCTKNCPPCRRSCNNRCFHSVCRHPCGEKCRPYRMPCSWRCEHHKCSKRCGEMCDRQKCNEPCRRILKCGHHCVGVCGDYCPRLCRVCNTEELQTIFLGREDEPDALYVELVDCGHVFEMNDLDYWMMGMEEAEGGDGQEDNVAIQLKVCPRCKTPIRRSFRYGNIVKETLLDIEKVKSIKLAEQQLLCSKKRELKIRVEELKKKHPELVTVVLQLRVSQLGCDADEYYTMDNQLRLFSDLGNIDEQFFQGSQNGVQSPNLSMTKESIRDRLNNEKLLTAQEVNDISENIAFLSLRCRFQRMLLQIEQNSSTLSKEIESDIESAKEIMSRQDIAIGSALGITDIDQAVVASVIESVYQALSFKPLTPEERTSIVKAFNFPKGHWYKCRNGHMYAIGECGGAMQKSKCPECNEVIGGAHHKLAEGNQLAPEMDGAEYPAWSEQANLQNYDPEVLRRLLR